jgi:hypothetical protein
VSKSTSGVEKEIERFISQYLIEHNTLNNKELISVSIRLSYKPSIKSRQVYIVLVDTDLNFVNSETSDLINTIKGRIVSRNIDYKTITSIHLHLHYK